VDRGQYWLAWGFCKKKKDFFKFLSIAQGSRAEVETQLILAERLDSIGAKETNALLAQLDEVARLLYGLMKSLERRSKGGRKAPIGA
jgi:four helix bundle protein